MYNRRITVVKSRTEYHMTKTCQMSLFCPLSTDHETV